MADYKVERITQARIADARSNDPLRPDDPTSVYIAFAAGSEQVSLTIDWRLASEVIDRLSVVNNEIRHALTAPDWRSRRIMAGFHRTGIGLAILLLLPVLWGGWVWSRGNLDPEAWQIIAAFALAAVLAYGVLWLFGWIISGFIGRRERVAPEPAPQPQPQSKPQPAPQAIADRQPVAAAETSAADLKFLQRS